ncbi:MAG: phosphoribosylamine--glycine ligase [Gammaproteobacteria bacterium]|nr:phosphoribosylamine--glycine ligase [Gammaproteobacteria bacterium]
MKVLIIGGGGREHALAWKCAQSPRVERVYCAPGNAGTAREAQVENVAIGAEDSGALVDFARDNAVGLTIVGPEAPLVAGVVDAFDAAGLKCFGPPQAAAVLEASKAYTKDFLARHRIPTAGYAVFEALDEALAHIDARRAPMVVKADGLAAGKGVVVAATHEEARAAARSMLGDGAFGEAGARVVVEDFLDGEEASFIVMSDGVTAIPFASSQDHKARDDGDRGPNTGGMGAYSPAPVIDQAMSETIMRTVIEPTLAGMRADGRPYRGFLYAGLMIGADGVPRVLEYNCRFGDPETQPIMMRLKTDLVTACLDVLEGRAADVALEWDARAALGVVLAAGGYPGDYARGAIISGLDDDLPDTYVFHAGTRTDGDRCVTNGGRVLCVVGLGADVSAAQRAAYARVDRIAWDGMFCRRDIGYRAVARERGA